MAINKQSQFVFYVVKAPNIKDFLIFDGLIGSGLFYTLKIATSNIVIGMIGSMIGVAAIKRMPVLKSRSV